MAQGIALIVTWKDLAGLHQFEKQIADLNTQFPKVLPRILNQVGDRAKTKVVRALTKQTGLKQDVVRRAVENNSRAFSGRLAYDMRSRGGNIRLKYLSPRETEAGVVAKPFGKSTLYPGAFLKGGAFPNRKVVGKFKLADALRPCILSRLDWHLWQDALETLHAALSGRLSQHALRPFFTNRQPWMHAELSVRSA